MTKVDSFSKFLRDELVGMADFSGIVTLDLPNVDSSTRHNFNNLLEAYDYNNVRFNKINPPDTLWIVRCENCSTREKANQLVLEALSQTATKSRIDELNIALHLSVCRFVGDADDETAEDDYINYQYYQGRRNILRSHLGILNNVYPIVGTWKRNAWRFQRDLF